MGLQPPWFTSSSQQLKSTAVRTLVLPKVHSADDLHQISKQMSLSSVFPLRLVASIESAKAMWNLGAIAEWKSSHGPEKGGALSALLVRTFIGIRLYLLVMLCASQFAAEDCSGIFSLYIIGF